jgi:hypothetical protein
MAQSCTKRIAVSRTIERGALLSKSSNKYLEYAINNAGVDYLRDTKKAGSITEGWVVLTKQRTVIAQKTIDEVVAMLANIAPREDGPWPDRPYWWFNADLTPNIRPLSPNMRSYRVDEIPY